MRPTLFSATIFFSTLVLTSIGLFADNATQALKSPNSTDPIIRIIDFLEKDIKRNQTNRFDAQKLTKLEQFREKYLDSKNSTARSKICNLLKSLCDSLYKTA
ncbi:unnamed protein product, partial [Mesorhabditis belari]|uniref:Uncharacterized protein n=1 Tax=Mesorhabditis belari TaxID=2138241 RepID=A0AAF3EHK6_9BILA